MTTARVIEGTDNCSFFKMDGTSDDTTATETVYQEENIDEVSALLAISSLYTQIGFQRKAAFYKRFAALKSVSRNSEWNRCYQLLLESLKNYSLTLDPVEYEKRARENPKGWAGIHIQILQEVITAARRLKKEKLAIRHLAFLLHVFFEHLTDEKRKHFATQLETLTKEAEVAPISAIEMEDGTMLSPVNLTKFPYVVSFSVQNLAPHLRPYVYKGKRRLSEPSANSPFIFTPINLNRPTQNVKANADDTQVMSFKWVQNEVGEISAQVHNFFPIDLHVNRMQLMTDGIEFEACPFSIILEPNVGPFPIIMTGIPRSHGRLNIMGYDTHVLGIKNSCLLKDLPHAKTMSCPHSFSIDVVPPLPLLSVSCPDLDKSTITSSLTPDIEYIVVNYPLVIYAGQKRPVTILLSNSSLNSDEVIEVVTTKIFSRMRRREEIQLISFSGDVDQHLPLQHGSTCEMSIDFNGFSDFVAEDKKGPLIRRRKSGTSTPLFAQNSGLASPSHTSSKKQSKQLTAALTNFLTSMKTSSGSQLKRHNRTHSVDRNEAVSEIVYPSRVSMKFQ